MRVAGRSTSYDPADYRILVYAMAHPWIADRSTTFDSSGIRKGFDLASQLGVIVEAECRQIQRNLPLIFDVPTHPCVHSTRYVHPRRAWRRVIACS